MTILSDVTFQNYDPEDIFDCVEKLEKSFGIKFKEDAFINVKTFGDLCDIIETHIEYPHSDDCTTQQAFYKIRSTLVSVSNTQEITLETKLEDILPRNSRIQRVKKFEQESGFPIDLDNKGWLEGAIIITILLSVLAFFFDWQLAVSGLAFSILANWIANKYFAKELRLLTVRQLTEQISREHYMQVRRNKQSVNRKEISTIIQNVFTNDLDIEKSCLTREAPLF